MLRLCSYVIFSLLSAAAFAQDFNAAGAFTYTDCPELDNSFFQRPISKDSFSTFRPQIQYGLTGGQTQGASQFGIAGWEAQALTYPRVNQLTEDGSAQALAYFDAQWQIAGYHARLLKSRLRREAQPQGIFGIYNQFAIQALYSGVIAEWEATQEELVAETGQGQNLLRSKAFADQYRAAADTVSFPLLEVRKHGMELHFALGPAFTSGGLAPTLSSGGFNMDLGIGYTYDRWLALLTVLVNQTPVAGVRERQLPQVQNERTQWNNVGLDLGYRYLRKDRWEASARLRMLGASLESGGGEDQTTLRSDFAPGLAHTVSYFLGKRYVGETASPRASGFKLIGILGYTQQRWLEDSQGGVINMSIGIQITGYGVGYTKV